MTSLPEPYHQSPGITLYLGDAQEILAALPSGVADCVVTSPPYWRQRDYGTRQWTGGDPHCRHRALARRPPATWQAARAPRCRCGAAHEDRQYGQERTPDAYITTLRGVFTQLARVLTDRGTVWLNLGDTYASRLPPVAVPAAPAGRAVIPLRRRNLLGLPWHVALALQADGWILRNAIVWSKNNAMPEPVTDRFTNRHEALFLLARRTDHHFDATAAEPWSHDGDVWTISTRPHHGTGTAAFPIDLPLRCIAAGCPAGGTVLDPFSGTATTGLAARTLQRSYIGVDLHRPSHDRGLARLADLPDPARDASRQGDR